MEVIMLLSLHKRIKLLILFSLLAHNKTNLYAMNNNDNAQQPSTKDENIENFIERAKKISDTLKNAVSKISRLNQSNLNQNQNQPNQNQPIVISLLDDSDDENQHHEGLKNNSQERREQNNNNYDNDKEDIDEKIENNNQTKSITKLSDFDYVQDLYQDEFLEYCKQGIINQNFVWIGTLNREEFNELQSTGQLQKMLLDHALGNNSDKLFEKNNADTSNASHNNEKNLSDEKADIEENITENQECTLCMDELPTSDFITLTCKHSFCKACLVDVFKPGLKEKNSKLWKCPATSCPEQIHNNDYEKILAGETIPVTELSSLPDDYSRDEIKELIKNGAFAQNKSMLEECKELLERENLLSHSKIKFCPIDYCKAHFYTYFKGIKTCELCKHQYCNNCLKYHDMNVSCEEHEQSLNIGKEKLIQETEKWLQEKTKECPNPTCKHRIEKDGGCQHMTCEKCKHEFCWICLGNWKNGPCSPYVCRSQKRCPHCTYGVSQNGESKHAVCQRPECSHHFCWICNERWNEQHQCQKSTITLNIEDSSDDSDS